MLVLTSGAWVVGFPVDLEVTGAPATTQVRFVYGTNLVAPGLCPPYTAPNCLAVRPIRLLGADQSDATGFATLSPLVPAIANAQVEVQATTTGPGNLQSNSFFVTVHQAASDNDADGLTAADEVSVWGTDPAVADTDGDTLVDGDEVALGTDALTADTDGDGFSDGDEVGRGSDPLDPASPPTWTNDVYPLFQLECAGCHVGPGAASGGLDLDFYANVVDEPSQDVPSMDRVEPFDPADSYLFHKLQGTQAGVGGSGLRMPRNGPPYLTATQTALVEDWILTGALE